MILDGGFAAFGDCVAVQYSSRSGRDPLFRSDLYLPVFQDYVVPLLQGKEAHDFRCLAEQIDGMKIDGQPLHTSIRYGVTQALLDAAAQSRGLTIAEVLAEEYGLTLAEKPVPLFCQTGDEWYDNLDKCILRRVPVFPHCLVNSPERFEQFLEYIPYVRSRILELAGSEFIPTLHFDLYGTLGLKCENRIGLMVDYLARFEQDARPYTLVIEEPVDMNSREKQIEVMSKLRSARDDAGLHVILCADEWCNTLDDIRAFVEGGGADMIQVKAPDLGGVQNIVKAILFCKGNGVRAYLGGSCCESIVSSRIIAHLGLASQPDQMLARPGMGIDESYTFMMNEMKRTLALFRVRKEGKWA